MLVNGSTAIEGLSGSGNGGSTVTGAGTIGDPEHMHWIGDVFQRLLAQVFESDCETAMGFIAHLGRDADSARGRQRLQPRGDVDTVAIAILALDDHLAEIDADPHLSSLCLGKRGVALGQTALQRHGTFNGVHYAAKFGE